MRDVGLDDQEHSERNKYEPIGCLEPSLYYDVSTTHWQKVASGKRYAEIRRFQIVEVHAIRGNISRLANSSVPFLPRCAL